MRPHFLSSLLVLRGRLCKPVSNYHPGSPARQQPEYPVVEIPGGTARPVTTPFSSFRATCTAAIRCCYIWVVMT